MTALTHALVVSRGRHVFRRGAKFIRLCLDRREVHHTLTASSHDLRVSLCRMRPSLGSTTVHFGGPPEGVPILSGPRGEEADQSRRRIHPEGRRLVFRSLQLFEQQFLEKRPDGGRWSRRGDHEGARDEGIDFSTERFACFRRRRKRYFGLTDLRK